MILKKKKTKKARHMQRKAKSQQHFYPWVNRSKALRIYLLSHITLLFFLPPSLPSLPSPLCAAFKKGEKQSKKEQSISFSAAQPFPIDT